MNSKNRSRLFEIGTRAYDREKDIVDFLLNKEAEHAGSDHQKWKSFQPGKGFLDVEVGIKDGKIAEIGNNLSGAAEVLDAAGNIVMPGVIDPHIHLGIFNDFAVECEHETRAALAGGVTTCGLFMGGDQSYLGQVGGLIDLIEAKSSVDMFMHLAIFTPDQMNEMEACYQEFGITSFKVLYGRGKRRFSQCQRRIYS